MENGKRSCRNERATTLILNFLLVWSKTTKKLVNISKHEQLPPQLPKLEWECSIWVHFLFQN